MSQNHPVSANVFDEIQSVCREFRRQLKQGQTERIEDYLIRVDDSARKTLFQNLLLLDIEFRRRSSEEPSSDEYVKRFPQFASLIRHAFFESTIMSMDALQSTPADGQIGSFDSFALVDSPKKEPTFEMLAARKLGEYELICELGRGGFGVVYEARHLQHQNRVALKTLPTGIEGQSRSLGDAERLHKFRREFRSLSEMNHPNLVGMQTLEVDGNQWFFTMDLIVGVDFLSYVRPDGDLSEGRLRTTLPQLAGGVIALHSQNIIHRDLKPSNVMVTADGKVVILDFGLVVELEQRTDQTASFSAHFAGTPRYAAPEQLFGQRSESSDWYSVGVMLHEALTGESPFVGSQMEILQRKQSQDPSPLTGRTDLPQDLATLADELLKRDPEQRPTISTIADALTLELDTITYDSMSELATDSSDTKHGLIGRDEQLAELEQAQRDLLNKREPIVVFISGRSGEGKSSLAEHFLQPIRLGNEIVVLSGRCYDRESVPFKAIDGLIDALVGYLRSLPNTDVLRLLPDDIRMLVHLFPIVRRVEAIADRTTSQISGIDSKQIRYRAFAALRDLLQRISKVTPIVIFIDDLQWGDSDSAGVMTSLLSPPDTPSILFLGSYRSDEIAESPFLHEWNELCKNAPETFDQREVHVAPLTQVQCVAFLASRFGNENKELHQQAAVLFQNTKGNPYFLEQLVEGFESSKSTYRAVSLNEITQEKFTKLPKDASTLLNAIAVSGKAISVAEASSVVGHDAPAFATLTHMRSEKLVRLIGSHDQQMVDTYHDKIRETVVDQLTVNSRQAIHLKLAEMIERQVQLSAEAPVRETEVVSQRIFDLAYHFLEADDPRAFNYNLRAGQIALDAFAMENALKHLTKADQIRPEILDNSKQYLLNFLLAKALSGSGQMVESIRHYELAVGFADRPIDRSSAYHGWGGTLWKKGEYDNARVKLGDALSQLGERLPRTLIGKLFGGCISLISLYLVPRWLSFRLRNRDEKELLQISRMYIEYQQMVTQVDLYAFVFAMTRSCIFAKHVKESTIRDSAYGNYAMMMAFCGLFLLGKRITTRLSHQLVPTRSSLGEGLNNYHLGVFAYCAGDLDTADKALRKAEQILGRAGDWRHCMVAHFSWHLWSVIGPANQIIRYASLEKEIGRQTNDGIVTAYGKYGLANGLSRRGETQQAIDLAQQAVAELEQKNATFKCMAHLELGRALLQASEFEGARNSLARAIKLVFMVRFFEISVPAFPLFVEAILSDRWQSRKNAISKSDLRKALRTAFIARLTGWLFRNNRPHAFRTSGRVAAANGRTKKAIKYFDKAIAAADKIGARYEHARSLIDKSVLDHPSATADRTRGLELLEELGCVLPGAECEYLNISKTSQTRPSADAKQ